MEHHSLPCQISELRITGAFDARSRSLVFQSLNIVFSERCSGALELQNVSNIIEKGIK